MATTQDVIERHLKAFSDQDLDGVLADYSANAVFFVPGEPLRGPDAIKPFFQKLIAEFALPEATFTLRRQEFEGDYAYLLWSAETPENSYEVATDTFVVQDGKIVAQSFAAKTTAKR